MHDEPDTLLVSVFVQCRQVEIRIRSDKVENEIFLLGIPVFPADVPAFDEQGVEAVFSCKIDISAHIFVVGAVSTVRCGVLIVGLTELHRREVVGVSPGALA